jgi:hypothetical protein
VRDLNRLAALHGFGRAERTGGGHLRFRHVSGAVVYTGSTPSDRRSWRNAVAMLRRTARMAAGGAR